VNFYCRGFHACPYVQAGIFTNGIVLFVAISVISGKKSYKVISKEKAKLFSSLCLGAFVANCFFYSKAVENLSSFIKSLKNFYAHGSPIPFENLLPHLM
jgi:hypothetical protein